jgi:anti-sigma factor RsiW
MPNCQSIERLVTPYVDGDIAAAERTLIESHLRVCAPCHSRVAAERAVRALMDTHRASLCAERASSSLRDICGRAAEDAARPVRSAFLPSRVPRVGGAGARWRPMALAASLVVIVGGAFTYQLTARSTTVLAAELAADHVKCFAANQLLGTHEDLATVESAMASGFGWTAHLPANASQEGLELVGERPCLYGEGRVAHIMYRYQGRPLSLFMLPDTERGESLVKALGHECAVWSEGGRTFVLVSREPRSDVQRLATYVRASLR